MKKISILSTATIVLAFSLYTIGSKCYAQQVKNKTEYVKDNSRGFEMKRKKGYNRNNKCERNVIFAAS